MKPPHTQFDRALEGSEKFFWMFCDDYVELVKARAYGDGNVDTPAVESAHATLRTVLDSSLRLPARFLPFVTEEAWSWKTGSIHRAAWPTAAELAAMADDTGPAVLLLTAGVLSEIRRGKVVQESLAAHPRPTINHQRVAAERDRPR